MRARSLFAVQLTNATAGKIAMTKLLCFLKLWILVLVSAKISARSYLHRSPKWMEALREPSHCYYTSIPIFNLYILDANMAVPD